MKTAVLASVAARMCEFGAEADREADKRDERVRPRGHVDLSVHYLSVYVCACGGLKPCLISRFSAEGGSRAMSPRAARRTALTKWIVRLSHSLS